MNITVLIDASGSMSVLGKETICESLVQTMIKAATSDDASYTLESIYNSAPK